MNSKGRIVILSSLITLLAIPYLLASSRYPSSSTLPGSAISKEEVTCKCDANKDPCCHPPVGESSEKVDPSKEKVSDVSKCKCDPKTDPCCKKIEGTTTNHKN